MTTYELDELQKFLKQKETILNAEKYLEYFKVSKTWAKLYLTTHLFVKIPDFFSDLSDEFKLVIHKVYNNENLNDNLPQYEIMLNKWKHTDSIQLIDELQSMRKQTKSAFVETENNQCKNCYKTQEKIMNVAETFLRVTVKDELS